MAFHILTDGTIKWVTPNNGTDFSLAELQGYVGGHIELVTIGSNHLMVVNEEGKLQGLEYNMLATVLAHQTHGISINDCIVGNVLTCLKSEIK